MRAKVNSSSKFVRFITYPIRVLGKAKDFYVRSLSEYANSGVGYGGGMGMPGGSIASLPKSFSVNSSRSEDSGMDYAELVRVASLKSSSGRRGHELISTTTTTTSGTGLTKSCSVAMGRIDEDGPCDFGQDDASYYNRNKDLLYPRSRSYAVAKRNLMF